MTKIFQKHLINFILAISPECLVLQDYQHLAVLLRQNTVSAHSLAELDIEATIFKTGSQQSLG